MFQANRLEGLGGPVHVSRPDFDDIDPTLESCCQREIETNRKGNALVAALSKHDVVAARERQRRNLITSEDCRCCFDPNQDGGEYRALIELKQQQRPQTDGEVGNDKKDDPDDEAEEDEFDYLLEDSELPEDEWRRTELEWNMLQNEIRKFHGYGSVRQMHPLRVLGAALRPPVCVLHLFDADSRASASLDLYLERTLAPKTMGTLFLRSDGRSTLLMNQSKYLSEIDPNHNLPALIALKNGAVVHQNLNLQGLTEDNGFIVESAVETWLDHCNVLRQTPPVDEDLCRIRPEEQALTDSMAPRFDCGVDGCYKTFPHEHVGISSHHLVSEEDVLGR